MKLTKLIDFGLRLAFIIAVLLTIAQLLVLFDVTERYRGAILFGLGIVLGFALSPKPKPAKPKNL